SDFRNLNIELDHKNNYLKSILESITSGVVAIDIHGKITNFSKGAEVLTGLQGTNVIGKPYMEILGREQNEKVTPIHSLKTRKPILNMEKEILLFDNRRLPVRYNSSQIKDSSGNVLGAVEIFSDITEIKHMEEEMQRFRTLSALGEMSAAVAHEIRNPLGGIGGFAALLERDIAADDPRKKLVRKIIKGVAILNKIVSNLLVYTRPMKGNFRDVCLNEILCDTLDFAMLGEGGLPKKDINIKKDFSDGNIISKCDPEKMNQLFLNLFQNSIEAMKDGDTLSIKIKENIRNGQFLCNRQVNGIIDIEIKDTGCGIPSGNITKLFNPFFTTREQGTGLGLAIAKKIIDLHNGEIKVLSETGKGTSFKIRIPT
ncbi:MAG: ATP-binding protein, partial [bacterium]